MTPSPQPSGGASLPDGRIAGVAVLVVAIGWLGFGVDGLAAAGIALLALLLSSVLGQVCVSNLVSEPRSLASAILAKMGIRMACFLAAAAWIATVGPTTAVLALVPVYVASLALELRHASAAAAKLQAVSASGRARLTPSIPA